MNKNKWISLVLVAFLIVLGFLVYNLLCDGEKLDTPANLQINEKTITWDKVNNASCYVIKIDNNTPVEVSKNSYSLMALTIPKTYIIKIRARGDGDKYLDSDWSEGKEYIVEAQVQQLAAPEPALISNQNQTLIYAFTHVANATGYKLAFTNESKIMFETVLTAPYNKNGVTLTVSGTTVTLAIAGLTNGAFGGMLKAVSANSGYTDSAAALLTATITGD